MSKTETEIVESVMGWKEDAREIERKIGITNDGAIRDGNRMQGWWEGYAAAVLRLRSSGGVPEELASGISNILDRLERDDSCGVFEVEEELWRILARHRSKQNPNAKTPERTKA